MTAATVRSLVVVVLLVSGLLMAGSAAAEWTAQATGVGDDLYGMYCLTEDVGYATGWGSSSGGVVLNTTNGGDSWASVVPRSGAYLFSTCFLDDRTGFAVGCDAGVTSYALISKTDDGGANWTHTLKSNSWGFYAVEFPTPTTGYTCGWQGKIYKTIDGGGTWAGLPSGTTDVIRWMHFVDENIGYVVSGTNWDNPSRVRKTVDGVTWTLVKSFTGGTVIGGIHFLDADTGLVAGSNGSEVIMKSTDGGLNWDVVHTGPAGRVLQAIHMNGETGYAVGSAGRILRTTDSGDTWELDEIVTPASTLLSVYAVGDCAFAGGAGGKMHRREPETGVDAVDEPHGLLLQNFPNPFNPNTTIRYELTRPGDAVVEVFDAAGRLVRRLTEENVPAGVHEMVWDGRDDERRPVASGAYYYRLETDDHSATRKMVLLK